MKQYLTSMNRKMLMFAVLVFAFVFTTSTAFAALTLNSNAVSSDGALTLTGTANSTWDLGTGHDLYLQTSGGKVGIGTASPSLALHIVGSANQLRLDNGSSATLDIKNSGNTT